MWIIIKYKTKEINLVFNNLKKVIGEMPEFCIPKIKYTRYFGKKIKNVEAFLLEDYLICYHKTFSDNSTLFKLKYLKGIKYCLDGFSSQQKEIQHFVSHCKRFEHNGYVSQDFFNNKDFKKGKFISGPFTNLVFNILEKKKNKLKVLIGDFKTIIANRKDCLYLPI